MPNLGTTSPSPASTPQLMLENNYRQLQEWGQRQEQELQSLGLDPEIFADRMQKLQADYDKRRAGIETNMNTVRQTQHWMDLGIIDSVTGEKLKWGAIVPEEALEMMFPEPETGPTRVPFTLGEKGQIAKYKTSVKQFAKSAEEVDIPGKFWDRPTHATLFQSYRTWRTAIGYDAMTFSQQRQVDNEWDTWVGQNMPASKWDPTSRGVRALRAKGPITRGFSARFRGTPVGPREAGDPLKDNIIANLPKQPAPESPTEAKPAEVKPARIHIRHKKTGKLQFSDDGGRTWQSSK